MTKITYNFPDGLTGYGEINPRKLFTMAFNEFPSTYNWYPDDKQRFDLPKTNLAKLKEVLGDFKYRIKSSNSIDDDNDYEDEEDVPIDIDFAKTSLIEIYSDLGIFTLNTSYIEYLYPTTIKDPEEIVVKITEALCFISNQGKSTEVGLVCISNGEYWVSRDSDSRINYTDINLEENYNDDFIAVNKKITEFLNPENRKSGVVLLSSIAGCGKTTLIKNFISQYPNNYIYITPGMASHLADPEFTSFLMNNKNSVFILEDCEEVIMDRSDSSISTAIAALLNMADGLMSDIFSGKFICTFNTDLDNIDKALLRPGRCIVNYRFEKLCTEKTKNLLNKRGIYLDNYEPLTLADIYNYENIDHKDELNSKIGF